MGIFGSSLFGGPGGSSPSSGGYYAPQDAFNYARPFISQANLAVLSPQILDDVNKLFWMYAPWRWTLGTLNPVSLTSNIQDYAQTFPSDFLFLQNAQIYDGKSTRVIKTAAYLPSVLGGLHSGQVNQVSVQSGTYRVLPVPGTLTAPTPQIISVYKKTAPLITAINAPTPGSQLFPDEYFWVYIEGVVWKAMYWAQDPRAGETKMQGSNPTYSGQLARFMDAMNEVKEIEKLNEVDSQQDNKQ